jgi:uncharacterized membrane protein
MRSANRRTGRALRGALLAAACAFAGSALAGGPLYVVPVNGTMKPLHWAGTAKVYLDKGNLNVGMDCVRDPATYECVLDSNGNPTYPTLDQQAGDDLVAATVAQWSGVPTSSFRAAIAGRSPADITGANVWNYIGPYNGGGIQTIYDADNSVIMEVTGGDGWGVLGIASPEWTSEQDSTQIIEGWQIIGGSFLSATSTDQISGVVTHEFGHAINLAHTQTNGFYSSNNPSAWSRYAGGGEQAGPDQCGPAAAGYPAANEIETMYPMIDPYPESPTYNSPEMAKVQDDADDMAALSAIYPAPGYAATSGTLKGLIVAKDGTSQITGINVIARRVDTPLAGALSRISGDSTQGVLGADGTFTMTGLVPGASYVVYIDELRAGAFSTPRSLLLGPEEYWNSAESGDASKDDACASTPVTLAAGESRQITIAVNGIPRAPTFTVIPYAMPTAVSDNGQRIAGIYDESNLSPYWAWDKTSFAKAGDVSYLGGYGLFGAISGNGRVIGGTVQGPYLLTDWDGVVLYQQRAALWTKETGWKQLANADWDGCDIFQTSILDLSTDGSTAVGGTFKGCAYYPFKWTAKSGMQLLSRIGDLSARANAVSGNGDVVVGWQDFRDDFPYRIGSIWQGKYQTILTEPKSVTDWNPPGYVGEVMAINTAGNVAVGIEAGADQNDSYIWTPTAGTRNLGGDKVPVCFWSWDVQDTVCAKRKTIAYSISDDAKVITGASRFSDFWNGVFAADGAIFTPKLGWMQLSKFLQSQGVLEAASWVFFSTRVSGDGKTLIGTGFPLASDYYQGYRIQLDQVFVCKGRKTLRVGFPDAMDQQLSAGATIGLCPGDAPL